MPNLGCQRARGARGEQGVFVSRREGERKRSQELEMQYDTPLLFIIANISIYLLMC